MKKIYASPEVEIEMFTFTDIVTTSVTGGIIDGGDGTTVDDDF